MSVEVYPSFNEAEITIIGTGGGYGESIIIHAGNKNWIVIDSCVSPVDGENLPLSYLQSIGVKLETEVKLIVCTHWHDDHIAGISEIYEKCKAARICFSQAHDITKFLQFVSLDFEKAKIPTSFSSTREFNKCLDICAERSEYIRAVADRLLYRLFVDDIEISLFALSPSDYTLTQFDGEISTLINEYGPKNKKWTIEKPNDKSVALYLKLGSTSAILGSDLEIGHNDESGWLNILKGNVLCLLNDVKSNYFKIPHHGSKNGYHPDIWSNLLKTNPTTSLTPWNKNKGLPTPEMLEKYKEHSSNLYITSTAVATRAKRRPRSIEKIMKEFSLDIKEVVFNKGIIRSKIDIKKLDPNWNVEIFGSAAKL